jgi:hypothetical protein
MAAHRAHLRRGRLLPRRLRAAPQATSSRFRKTYIKKAGEFLKKPPGPHKPSKLARTVRYKTELLKAESMRSHKKGPLAAGLKPGRHFLPERRIPCSLAPLLPRSLPHFASLFCTDSGHPLLQSETAFESLPDILIRIAANVPSTRIQKMTKVLDRRSDERGGCSKALPGIQSGKAASAAAGNRHPRRSWSHGPRCFEQPFSNLRGK